LELAQADQLPVVDVDVPERASDADVLAHRAPGEHDLAIERGGGVHDLLHAMDVGGEARDDDAPLAPREDFAQVRPDERLRGREPGTVDVGRVAAQEQYAVAPELGEARDVGG